MKASFRSYNPIEQFEGMCTAKRRKIQERHMRALGISCIWALYLFNPYTIDIKNIENACAICTTQSLYSPNSYIKQRKIVNKTFSGPS